MLATKANIKTALTLSTNYFSSITNHSTLWRWRVWHEKHKILRNYLIVVFYFLPTSVCLCDTSMNCTVSTHMYDPFKSTTKKWSLRLDVNQQQISVWGCCCTTKQLTIYKTRNTTIGKPVLFYKPYHVTNRRNFKVVDYQIQVMYVINMVWVLLTHNLT